MNDNEINDKRLEKDFRSISFSGYKKSAAKKELLNYLFANKIEESVYWSVELICAGHYVLLWDTIFLFISKFVNLGNPRLPLYIEIRLNDFKNILNSGYSDNELKLRNNDKIRKLFAEVICVLCLSKKKNSFDSPKIKDKEYHSVNLTHKLKAPTVDYANKIFRKDDPKELFISINELAWNIDKKNKNSSEAYYWVEWILGFESICKKNKQIKTQGSRREAPVESKYQNDIIWIIWDVIFQESKKHPEGIQKIIEALLNLFSVRYSPGSKKRRKTMIYFAISLLTEPFDANIPLYKDGKTISKVTGKINNIYKQIKKNEVKPLTDYLFKNTWNGGNLEKTIDKLNRMDAITNMIPRNK